VVRQEGPGKDGETGLHVDIGQTVDEVLPIPLSPKDELPVQSTDHHVVESTRHIEARPTGHNVRITSLG
jgi:hypothetical protein